MRICLTMQGIHVQSLLQQDPTCHRAAKPPELELEPALHSRRSDGSEKPTRHPWGGALEKACAQQHRLSAAKDEREKQSAPQQFYFREL